MKNFIRFFVIFSVLSMISLIGCMGGNDNDTGYSPVSTGEILVSAFADSGNKGTFVAAQRDTNLPALRAAVSTRFQARIKVDDGSPLLYDLERSDDGKKLTLANVVLNSVAPGAHRVTVEIIKKGAAAGSPAVLKRIGNATVVAGQTNDSDIKNIEINYDSTAKALVYEAWAQNNSKTIDEMSVDLSALKTAIQNRIIKSGNIDGESGLDLAALKAEIDNAVAKITVLDISKTRFEGDYRAFFVNALGSLRWVGVSDVLVTGGKITETIKVSSDLSRVVGTDASYSVTESSGELYFSTVTKNRGAVAASGNVAMIHVWNKTPYLGLMIKKPADASNATLKGTYNVFAFSDAVDGSFKPSQPGVQAYSLKFDGEGGFTQSSSFDPDSLASIFSSGSYSVAGGGRIKFSDSKTEYAQVSPDGNLFAFVSYSAGGRCIFAIGVKQNSDSTWNGSFIETGVYAGVDGGAYQSYSQGAMVSVSGNSYVQSDAKTEKSTADADKNLSYTINKGAITLGSVDALAAVDPAGELYCIVGKSSATGRYCSFGVKK